MAHICAGSRRGSIRQERWKYIRRGNHCQTLAKASKDRPIFTLKLAQYLALDKIWLFWYLATGVGSRTKRMSPTEVSASPQGLPQCLLDPPGRARFFLKSRGFLAFLGRPKYSKYPLLTNWRFFDRLLRHLRMAYDHRLKEDQSCEPHHASLGVQRRS